MILIHFWLEQAESLLEMLNYYAAPFGATLRDTVNLQRNMELAVSRSGCDTFFMCDSFTEVSLYELWPRDPYVPSNQPPRSHSQVFSVLYIKAVLH